MTRARVAPATAAPLRVSARTTSRAHRRIPEDPPAEHDRRDRKGIERPPRPRSPQRWRTLPGPASSPTPRQPSSHGAHPQPPRGRPRRPPRATRSGRPSPPRWTTALCAAHGSWRTSSRAARRAQSTCPPTTAAHAATASRSGAKAVPPRITPSCTACRPSAGNPEAADKTHTPSVRARMTTPSAWWRREEESSGLHAGSRLVSLGDLALIVAAGLVGPLLAASRRAFSPVVALGRGPRWRRAWQRWLRRWGLVVAELTGTGHIAVYAVLLASGSAAIVLPTLPPPLGAAGPPAGRRKPRRRRLAARRVMRSGPPRPRGTR